MNSLFLHDSKSLVGNLSYELSLSSNMGKNCQRAVVGNIAVNIAPCLLHGVRQLLEVRQCNYDKVMPSQCPEILLGVHVGMCLASR